jgi:DNA ligase 1
MLATLELSVVAFTMVAVLLAEVVATSAAVAATRSRTAKIAALAGLLRRLEPDEVEPAVGFLAGTPRQRTGVGWASVFRLDVPAATQASLTVRDVDVLLSALETVSGAGSVTRRRELLTDALGRATADEQDYLRRLLVGELRQGALEGVLTDAVAAAAQVPAPAVRRALMLSGELAATAAAALTGGVAALDEFRLRVGRAVRPMLATPAETLDDALAELGECSVEHKMDGARIQVHRDGDAVWVFTRTLNEITARVPELVRVVRALPCESIVLDGETLALTDDGKPRPFGETMSRFGTRLLATSAGESTPPASHGASRKENTSATSHGAPAEENTSTTSHGAPVEESTPARSPREELLHPYFFDCLHLDGVDLLDEPLARRLAAIDQVAAKYRMPGVVTADPAAATAVLDDAIAAGHEGVVVKSLVSAYIAGRRGRAWQKIKRVHTFDLVVIGVEWGHGRRRGWLSNLHLGARDPDGGPPVMVGKTFKGMTDELLAWQTRELQSRQVHTDGYAVYVRPELVVEIELDGVVPSPRYPGGIALRFARVVRYRPDKNPAEADTIDTLRALLS